MMETELVPREGYLIRTVEISNLSRSLSLDGLKHNLHTARNVVRSVREAKKIIRDFSPNAVIGTGEGRTKKEAEQMAARAAMLAMDRS